VRWAWQERIALGKITTLAGRPKIGKGLLYSHLIAHVTTGRLEGDLEGPRDVIVVTTEDGDTLKPRLMAASADLSRVSIFQMGSADEPVPFRVPQDAAELGRRAAERKAALVVIDPLMEFIDGKVDSHKSHPVRQAIAALNSIARKHGCAVLVIFHLNKGAATDPLLRHEGSAAFTQVVRGGLMLGHDPDDPDGEDGNQRVLAVSSTNLAAIAPSIVYRISTAHVMGDTGEAITTAAISPIGESAVGAHDLLRGRPDEEEQSGTDEAEALLSEELADGPR
jgi:RecA-family ATPase